MSIKRLESKTFYNECDSIGVSPDIHSSSVEYDQRFAGEIGDFILSVQTGILRGLLENARSRASASTLLDLGGGHGQVFPLALELGFNTVVHGSDQSCRRKIDQYLQAHPEVQDGRLRFVNAPLLDVPAKPQSFDVVSMLRLISHHSDWQALIAESCRLAKSTVIVEFPPLIGFNLLYPILFKIKQRAEGSTRYFLTFSLRQLDAEFERHGFKRSFRRNELFAPIVVHRKLRSVRLSKFFESACSVLGLTALFGNPTIAEYRRTDP